MEARVALVAVSLSPGCTRIVEDGSGVVVTDEEAGPFPADYEDVVRRWAVRERRRCGQEKRGAGHATCADPSLGLS